jgi:hypothetical protein
LHPACFALRERTPVLIGWEPGWALRLTRRFGDKRNLFYRELNSGPFSPLLSLYTEYAVAAECNPSKSASVSFRYSTYCSEILRFLTDSMKFFWSRIRRCIRTGYVLPAALALSCFGSSSDSRTRQYYQPPVTVYF